MKVRMAVEQPNKDAFIEQVMRKYHFSTEEKEALQQVYEKVRTYMAPYAIYRINTRMRGVPLLDAEQSALVAMTLGEGVDRLQEYYEREHALSESYMVECVANELLLQMYADFNQSYPKFHRRYVKRHLSERKFRSMACRSCLQRYMADSRQISDRKMILRQMNMAYYSRRKVWCFSHCCLTIRNSIARASV